MIWKDNDALWDQMKNTEKPNKKAARREAAGLTRSDWSRAKMAKVDSLSHTHLVRNESTSTALQPLADQDPSREELTHTHRGREE